LVFVGGHNLNRKVGRAVAEAVGQFAVGQTLLESVSLRVRRLRFPTTVAIGIASA
jgi:hypothetical protein